MLLDLARTLYANDQVRILVLLILANLVLGTAASLVSQDFKLTHLADWLYRRVLPMLLGYGGARILALAGPDLGIPLGVDTIAFAALAAMLVGYCLRSLREIGFPLPDALAGGGRAPGG